MLLDHLFQIISLTLVWCWGLLGLFSFFYQMKKYTINYFFQTQTHWPWLILCEEYISEHIFNEKKTVHPSPYTFTLHTGCSGPMDPRLIKVWKL